MFICFYESKALSEENVQKLQNCQAEKEDICDLQKSKA